MSPRPQQRLLNERYRLTLSLGHEADGSELWIAADRDESPLLVKTWYYTGPKPDDVNHALWDTTLRVLYRLSSSAGAARCLLLLRDAGIDAEARVFAMVLKAPGQTYVRLAEALREHPELYPTSADERLEVWRALHRVAEGITLLHHQQVLHRNVGAEVAFLDPAGGLDTLRLGGFEWSTRIGMTVGRNPAMGWSHPPEFLSGGSTAYRMETDWFGFGVLAARLLVPLENHAGNRPDQRLSRTIAAVRNRRIQQMSRLERDLILALLEKEPDDRLDRVDDIQQAIGEITRALEHGARAARGGEYLVLVISHTNQDIVDASEAVGFLADPTDTSEPYNPNNRVHKTRLLDFVRADLEEQPRLMRLLGQERFILVGNQLSYWVQPFYDNDRGAKTWEVAFCPAPADLRGGTSGSSVDLSHVTVSVRGVSDAYESAVRRDAMSWTRVLPLLTTAEELRPRAQRLLGIVRATNQVELPNLILLRQATPLRQSITDRNILTLRRVRRHF